MTKQQKLNTSNLTANQIGIKGIEIYIPTQFVNQSDLEIADGVSTGKYTIGLGQTNMSFVNDREDIYSMSLTVLQNLINNYNIDPKKIGRLEVGTETLIDKSKSVKSVLMQLFAESDNHDIEGIDTINACYGGTNALFNSLNWLESSQWDGRDAIVVCGDIAIYDKGPARPTGGAGMVAIWLGHNAPLVVDPIRSTYIEHVYDFYKPDLTSEYPYVEGHYSLQCYIKALDKVYDTYRTKINKNTASDDDDKIFNALDNFDYNIFHVPNGKLVQKSFARLIYKDWLANKQLFTQIDQSLRDIEYEESLTNKTIEKTFMNVSKQFYEERVKPSLIVPTNTGNMYTASLYSSLVSLLYYIGSKDLQNKKICAFSYGSGMAASMFTITVNNDITYITDKLNLQNILDNRIKRSPDEYEADIKLREDIHLRKNVKPVGSIDHLAKGTYYLTEIDDRFKRYYNIKE